MAVDAWTDRGVFGEMTRIEQDRECTGQQKELWEPAGIIEWNVCVCVKSKRSNFVIREFEDERSHTTKETLGNASGSPTDETHTTR